jgi:hypothetical protein
VSSDPLETLLARLYTDGDARERFLSDPHAEAARAGLTPSEAASVAAVDRDGLEAAAASFASKRRAAALDSLSAIPGPERTFWATLLQNPFKKG